MGGAPCRFKPGRRIEHLQGVGLTVADLSLSCGFGARNADLKGLKLNLAVSNLFDKEYIASCPLVGGSTNRAGLTGYRFRGEGRVANASLNDKRQGGRGRDAEAGDGPVRYGGNPGGAGGFLRPPAGEYRTQPAPYAAKRPRAVAIADRYAAGPSRLAGLIDGAERPEVMIHLHADGMPCCTLVGDGAFADMIKAAGGRLPEGLFADAPTRQFSVEGMLSATPDFYISPPAAAMSRIAAAWRPGLGRMALGPGVSAAIWRTGRRPGARSRA